MKLFIKDTIGLILLYILNFCVISSVYYVFGGFDSNINILYFIFLSSFLLICYLIIRYYKNKKIYKSLTKTHENFEKLLGGFGASPLGVEINSLVEDLYSFHQREMHLQVTKQKEHLYFINQWIHNMKTPLSVIKLNMQDNDSEAFVAEISEEVDKLERGLNLALYNARLDDFERDFNIRNFNLREVVYEEINSLKRFFIKNKIFPKVDIDEGITINSDKKWIMFILDQLITNGVKYSANKGKYLYIRAIKDKNKTTIQVEDEGIGIPKRDIKRVFEAFYTGIHGREYGESTGMGLYLVKEVCNKLGHNVIIESEEDKGTVVTVVIK